MKTSQDITELDSALEDLQALPRSSKTQPINMPDESAAAKKHER